MKAKDDRSREFNQSPKRFTWAAMKLAALGIRLVRVYKFPVLIHEGHSNSRQILHRLKKEDSRGRHKSTKQEYPMYTLRKHRLYFAND